ncbi:MAG: Ldh family oxidoreductase [Natronohydrobacter sp.]|nr:Ldh family oxidoreductase [Natronohydrobacter sp.]
MSSFIFDSQEGTTISVARDDLEQVLYRLASAATDERMARCIVEKVIMGEMMKVPTHGLHYFIHALLPLLRKGEINTGEISTNGSIVYCEGTRGIGFLKLEDALDVASDVARDLGSATLVMRNPGKVGAFRVYCEKLTKRGQLVIMVKNTARTVGVPQTGEAVFGTNPLAIGLPGTGFIYDSSMSTVATNKVRLAQKYGREFPNPVGLSDTMQETGDPHQITTPGGALLPFSAGPYWFKSFFLGIAIEAMAGLAGGKTGRRVGEHKGKRLYSEEGLMAFVIDSSASPDYDAYLAEVELLLSELREKGLKIPGEYDAEQTHFSVLLDDWKEINES